MKLKIENVKVFEKEGKYSISIGNKKEDGTWDNMFIPVSFPKGSTIENKTEVDILDGFMSFYVNKDNVKVLKIVVMNYKVVGDKPSDGEYITIDSDLPF